MKKLLIAFFFIVFSFSVSAQLQFPSAGGSPNTVATYQGGVKGKLYFMLPVIDTLNNKATPYTGALTILPNDTLNKEGFPPIYMTNGRFWGRISGGGSAGVDSLIIRNGNLCVWSGGISTCYALNKYYDSSALNHDSTYTYHYSSGNFVDSVFNPHIKIYEDINSGFKVRDTLVNSLRAYVFASGRIDTLYHRGSYDYRLYMSGALDSVLSGTGTTYFAGQNIIIQNDTINAVNNTANGVISGGVVSWLHDYVYNISAAVYVINNVIYSSVSTDVTLDPADATLDRIDAFVLTTSGTAEVVTGVPSIPATSPSIETDTQLEVSFATVLHNTTSPANITNDWIYLENTEWVTTRSAVTINLASTNNPYAGTKDIEGTLVANSTFMTFTPTSVNTGLYQNILFQIRSKANWQNTKKWILRWYSGTTPIGLPVIFGSGTFGFISTNTTDYQTISIPLNSFGNISTATSLRITQNNSSGTVGWYLDNMQLQAAQGGGVSTKGVVSFTKNATNDSSILILVDGTRYAVKDSVSGGGGTTGRFGIEDSLGLQDRSINMQNHS